MTETESLREGEKQDKGKLEGVGGGSTFQKGTVKISLEQSKSELVRRSAIRQIVYVSQPKVVKRHHGRIPKHDQRSTWSGGALTCNPFH